VSRSSNSAVTLRLSAHGFGFDTGTAIAMMQLGPAGHDVKTVAAALNELSLEEQPGKSLLRVILDDAWTRLQVVRFPAQVSTAEERQVFLKENFRRVFGVEAQDWTIVAEPAHFGLPAMAVAVDQALLASLTRFAERHRLRLCGVQPEFIDAFNRARAMLSGRQGAFAQIGDERVCMALWRGQRWIAVRSQPMDPAVDGAMRAMLAQMLANVDPPMASGTLHMTGADGRPRWSGQQLADDFTAGWTAMQLPAHTP
jgi:hypothetical protein